MKSDGRFEPTHGEVTGGVRTVEYVAWQSMRSRCLYPKDKRFKHYGGRGIGICDRWGVFENFLADMGRKPGPNHSLDRIDNDKDYCAENCRWATSSEQNRNRSNTRLVKIGDELISLAEACSRTGVNYFTAHARLRKGLPLGQALSPKSMRA